MSIFAALPFFGPPGLLPLLTPLLIPLILGTVVLALVVAVRPHLAPRLAVLYAVLEGLLLGLISRILDLQYPGIASQALLLTVGVAAGMLFIYRARVINVTRNFRIAVTAATLGVFLAYMASLIGRFAGFEVPLLHESTPAGIAVSVFIVGLAAMNLALDFDFIERGVERRLPQQYEWVAAFGLIVTLAWLYIELLRLLAKLRSR
jgi:uncharacterized YccA/Bax inhibitor family protein